MSIRTEQHGHRRTERSGQTSDGTDDVDLESFSFFPDREDLEWGRSTFRTRSTPAESGTPNTPAQAVAGEPIDGRDNLRRRRPIRRLLAARTLATAFGVVALIEGVFLIDQVTRTPQPPVVTSPIPVTIEAPDVGDVVVVDGRPIGRTPFRLEVDASVHTIAIQRSQGGQAALTLPTPPPSEPEPRSTTPTVEAGPAQRSGGLRLSSPLDVQVVERDTVLGWSTDPRPIVLTAGVHQLDLVNAALGYRARQAVTITAGEVVTLTVTPPNGRVSINAQPWAQVWIDGKPVGETPLANVPVPIGDHEIIFRHPQLGEKRQKARVSVDIPTRLSARMGS